MSLFDFLGSSGGSFLGGLAGMAGQLATNAQNERLMRESWSREDTAVQRRTKDLEAAGINPLLAAGQAASSSGPVQMSNPLEGAQDIASNVMAIQSAKKNIAQADASIALAQASKDKTNLEASNQFMLNNLLDRRLKTTIIDENGQEHDYATWSALRNIENERNQNATLAATLRGAQADADAKQTNADALAYDLGRAKKANVFFAGGQNAKDMIDLGGMFNPTKKGGDPLLGSILGLALKIAPNIAGGLVK